MNAVLDTNYISQATISPCGRYRAHLCRLWDRTKEHALFIMLNPSTADAMLNDPTIRRSIGFARSWGLGGIAVVNLFQLRATDPKALLAGGALNPPDADEVIDTQMLQTGVIVAAWGALHPRLAYRAREVQKIADRRGRSLHHLGKTKDGWPKHPLYLRGDAQLEIYRSPS